MNLVVTASLGVWLRAHYHPVADWENVKDDVMRRAVLRKFETHWDVRKILLKTGDEELVENAPGDYYWGCGADGSGQSFESAREGRTQALNLTGRSTGQQSRRAEFARPIPLGAMK